MSEFVTGQITEARCSRCKDITGHVVMACLNGIPVKVKCRACGSEHKYYPPEPARKREAEKTVRVRTGNSRAEAVASAARTSRRIVDKKIDRAEQQKLRKAGEHEQNWRRKLEGRTESSAIPYSMSTVFAAGNLVRHSVFGLGVVLDVLPPDKMDVIFQEGVKRLRCAC